MAAVEDISAGEWIEIGDTRKFVFCVNGVYVYVYEKSLTKVEGIEALVNPTNPSLGHGFGVSRHVANAAGSTMIQECEQYVKDFGHVSVKENFVSTAGNLPYKGIIHAVGPQWDDYSGDLTKCARHLYQTILNVLTTTCTKGWKSVAIPAISSGSAGIPKKLCAEMYVKALIQFPISGQSGIKEIHFVDTNSEIIDHVVTAYEGAFEDPSLLVFENAENYPGMGLTLQPTQHKANRTVVGSAVTSNHQTQPAGSNQSPYTITNGSLKTLIYSGSITQIQGMDGIVNSTINTLEHRCGVANEIAKAAGDGVVTECNDYVKKSGNLKVTENFISSGGNLSCSGIIHVVGPQWKYYNNDRSKCADDLRLAVVNALQSARKRNWRKLAMTAMSSNHSGVPKDLCAAEYTIAIAEFANSGAGSLVEVHFIDKDKTILDMVINAHKASS